MLPTTPQPPELSLPSSLDDAQRFVAENRPSPVRRGEVCPRCGIGQLDYNGLLDLECPVCGYSEGPSGGCT